MSALLQNWAKRGYTNGVNAPASVHNGIPFEADGTLAVAIDASIANYHQGLGSSVTSMTNQVTGGSVYDLDVVVGTGANLKKSISDACLMYGASGDYVSTPAQDMSTLNKIIAYDVALDDWTPAGFTMITSQTDASSQEAFYLGVKNSVAGTLRFAWSNDGASLNVADSTVVVPASDGQQISIKVELTSTTCIFYTSTDRGGNWTKLGDTITITLGTIFNSSNVIEVGSSQSGTANLLNGTIGQVELYNASTLAVDFNAAYYVNRSSDTQFPSSSTGEVWTLNGNTFIQNTGHSVVHSIGSVGLETSVGQTIANPFTVFCVAKPIDAPSADQVLFDAKSESGERIFMFTDFSDSNNFDWSNGSTIRTLPFSTGLKLFTFQANGNSSSKFTAGDNSVVGDSGSNDWDFASLFVNISGATPWVGYIAQLIVFDRQLTEPEVADMQEYLDNSFLL